LSQTAKYAFVKKRSGVVRGKAGGFVSIDEAERAGREGFLDRCALTAGLGVPEVLEDEYFLPTLSLSYILPFSQ